ncbi:cell wall protein, partial [Streptomyces sp. SID4915]
MTHPYPDPVPPAPPSPEPVPPGPDRPDPVPGPQP